VQAAGPFSNRNDIRKPSDTPPGMCQTIRRSAASEPSGKTPAPPQSEPSAEAIHERALWQAAGPITKHMPPCEPSCIPRRPPSDPSSKPFPRSCVRSGAQAADSGCRRYQTEPLRLFAVNPLMVGELGRRVIGEVILE